MFKWFVGIVALVLLVLISMVAMVGETAPPVPYLPSCGLEFSVFPSDPGNVPSSLMAQAHWTNCEGDVAFEATWTSPAGEQVHFRVSPDDSAIR